MTNLQAKLAKIVPFKITTYLNCGAVDKYWTWSDFDNFQEQKIRYNKIQFKLLNVKVGCSSNY